MAACLLVSAVAPEAYATVARAATVRSVAITPTAGMGGLAASQISPAYRQPTLTSSVLEQTTLPHIAARGPAALSAAPHTFIPTISQSQATALQPARQMSALAPAAQVAKPAAAVSALKSLTTTGRKVSKAQAAPSSRGLRGILRGLFDGRLQNKDAANEFEVLGDAFKPRPGWSDEDGGEARAKGEVPTPRGKLPKKRPKKKYRLMKWGFAIALIAVGITAVYFYVSPKLRPVDPGSTTVIVENAPYHLTADPEAQVLRTDEADSQRLFSLIGHEAVVRSLSVSEDGNKILTVSENGAWRLWDLETGKSFTPEDYPGPARAALFADSGKKLILIDQDATIRVVDLVKGKSQTLGSDIGALKFHAVSPDEQRVTLVTKTKMVRTVTLKDGSAHALQAEGSVLALGSTDKGEMLLTSKRGMLKLWLIRPGQQPEVVLEKVMPGIRVLSSSVSRDGELIYFVANMSGSQMIVAWPFGVEGAEGLTYLSSEDFAVEDIYVAGIAATPDGKTAAFLMEDGRVYLWGLGKGKPVLVGQAASGSSVFISKDGKTIYTGSADGRIAAWSVPE
jgi:hypothetical protein